jgi:Ser/Thr protein kinase RdoA (MazF antagonist)
VDGGFVRMLEAPEGPRPAVLFSHADGRPRHRELDSDHVGSIYGQLLAAMHQATDDFRTPHARAALDLDYLLDRPLATIRPFLEHRASDWTYLVDIADRLRKRVTQLSDSLDWGFCHGDFHGWNVHVTDDNALTVFDFDCCGPGWRALDLAIFRRSLMWSKNDSAIWPSFVRGYVEHRPASEADHAAIASFVPIWEIWLLGSRTARVRDWGILWLEDRLNQGLSFLREWDTTE